MFYLSQCAHQFPQEVSILQIAADIVVNVEHLKLQVLHCLKVVVNDKSLGEFGVEAVHDSLRPTNLNQKSFSCTGCSFRQNNRN